VAVPEGYALIIHSTTWQTKLWPEERWRNLIQRLTATGHPVVLPWGSVDEQRRATRLSDGIAAASALPRKLNSGEVSELIAGAAFAVGVDTGLMHLAAAFDVPAVTLFGPTDPGYLMPYGANQRAVISSHPDAPCRQDRCLREPHGQCCMRAIDPDEVWAAVSAMLSEQAVALPR
jgi:heptosyltransferase-1